MPNPNPESLATSDEFIAFIEGLRRDLAAENASVANLTLDDFLEALCAWTRDSDLKGSPESWSFAARLLHSGLIYE